MGAFAYAEDIILNAPTKQSLHGRLKLANIFSLDYRIYSMLQGINRYANYLNCLEEIIHIFYPICVKTSTLMNKLKRALAIL